jgi:hypothetical protein
MHTHPDDLGDKVKLVFSAAELALLKRYNFPGTRALLRTARPVLEGFALYGSVTDVDCLRRWVSPEVNEAINLGHPHTLLSNILQEIVINLLI